MAKRKAIIVDIDGTIVSLAWRLGLYKQQVRRGKGKQRHNWGPFAARMARDRLNPEMVRKMAEYRAKGTEIILMSTRPDELRPAIAADLKRRGVPFDQLILRPSGDWRESEVVKRDIYRTRIKPKFDVVEAFDDHQDVLDMWKEEGVPATLVTDPGLPPRAQSAKDFELIRGLPGVVVVPPYMRVRNGKIENVSGYSYGKAVARLAVLLARVVVPPYQRVQDGQVENVSGYEYDRDSVARVKGLLAQDKRINVTAKTTQGPEPTDSAEPVKEKAHPLAKYGITYFDSNTCSRCGGTGEFSYNMRDGTMCYGCSGYGRQLTKEAQRGYDEYLADRDKIIYPKPSDLKPGDLITWPPGQRPQKWATVVSTAPGKPTSWSGPERTPNPSVVVTVHVNGGEESQNLSDNPWKPFMGPGMRRKPKPGEAPDKSKYEGYVGFRPQGWRLGGYYEPTKEQVAAEKRQQAAHQKAVEAEARRKAEEAKNPPPPPPPPPKPDYIDIVADSPETGTHAREGTKRWTAVDIGGKRIWQMEGKGRLDMTGPMAQAFNRELDRMRKAGEQPPLQAMLPLLSQGKLEGDEVLKNPNLLAAADIAIGLLGDKARWSDFIQSMQERRLYGSAYTPAQARGILNTLRKQIITYFSGLTPLDLPAGVAEIAP